MNYEYMTVQEENDYFTSSAKADTDMVNSPEHYANSSIECIDAIRAALGEDGFKAHCRGTALKYVWRAGKKWDAEEDIKKAIWYLERYLT